MAVAVLFSFATLCAMYRTWPKNTPHRCEPSNASPPPTHPPTHTPTHPHTHTPTHPHTHTPTHPPTPTHPLTHPLSLPLVGCDRQLCFAHLTLGQESPKGLAEGQSGGANGNGAMVGGWRVFEKETTHSALGWPTHLVRELEPWLASGFKGLVFAKSSSRLNI